MYTLVRHGEQEELVNYTLSHSLQVGIILLVMLLSPFF